MLYAARADLPLAIRGRICMHEFKPTTGRGGVSVGGVSHRPGRASNRRSAWLLAGVQLPREWREIRGICAGSAALRRPARLRADSLACSTGPAPAVARETVVISPSLGHDGDSRGLGL